MIAKTFQDNSGPAGLPKGFKLYATIMCFPNFDFLCAGISKHNTKIPSPQNIYLNIFNFLYLTARLKMFGSFLEFTLYLYF